MKIFPLVFLALPYGVLSETCSYWDGGVTYRGNCLSPSACNGNGGFYVDNKCSGGSNNKCCLYADCGGPYNDYYRCINSNTNAGKDTCSDIGGRFVSGRCPGPSGVKCCVT